MKSRFTAVLLAACLLAGGAQARPEDAFIAAPRLTPANAAEVTAACDTYLTRVAELRSSLEAETGPAGIATLRDYDDLYLVLDAATQDALVVASVGADAARRAAAAACQARAADAANAIAASPAIYRRLKAVPAAALAADARHILRRALAAYERGGAAADPAQRARIAALQAQIAADGIAFDTNINNGRKTFTATPDELAGLPDDFVAAHPPGPDGLVTLSTDYPDLNPVMAYATSAALRERMIRASATRAWPANDALLRRLFDARHALAHELGRPDYASVALADKMLDTPARARAFITEIAAAAEPAAQRDQARMLARLQAIDPGATALSPVNAAFIKQLILKESYGVDPKEVRRYFAFDNVRKGIFQLTEDLFGVTVRPWDTPVWDKSVSAFEMVDDGRVIGRFYLDMHPRPGKYTHAYAVPIRIGIAGRAIPVSLLMTNFPAGGHDTGLMEHREVETFLHEYGHLLHHIFAGRVGWQRAKTFNVEWDFIEAPSQMLENWVWDHETLKRFAVDSAGNTIPADLVARMNRARHFGEAISDRGGLGGANVSLAYHSGPAPADLTAAYAAAFNLYALVPMLGGTHPQASFSHLNNYSAYYYTYAWSKLIATDLFTRFAANGLRDRATARRYRDLVLAPGASRPAADMLADFLGRPVNINAYRARLAQGNR
jgi:thimet oligopeptidase